MPALVWVKPKKPRRVSTLSLPQLTTAEMRIADLVLQGFGTKEIARRLKRTEGTVKNHMTNIMRKFGVSSRYKLITKASRGLFEAA